VSRPRVAVLVSGNGSNLQALLDAFRAPEAPAEIALVVSNVAEAYAVTRAREAAVPVAVLSHAAYPDRHAFETALVQTLQSAAIDWVCLAGFMRLLGPTFLSAYRMRTLNIHPSLLPAFPGLQAPRQALEAGVRVSGCTVHFVDDGTDTGPIIEQAAVEVRDDDDPVRLAARILEQEHRIYPLALSAAVRGELRIQGRRVLRA
jgi:phosphoribosylglycinamide formyltransferase-1